MTHKQYIQLINHATASGETDAPVLRPQGTGDSNITDQKLTKPKLISFKRKIQIGTWNLRTGHHVGQKEIIARELYNHNISIAVLSELRITNSGSLNVQISETNNSMTLFYSGNTIHTEGVGFMVDQRPTSSVIFFQPISSRIAILTLNSTIKTHIIGIYAPTEPSASEQKDEFYALLQNTFDSLPRSDFTILAGDINAHVGSSTYGWEKTLGKYW